MSDKEKRTNPVLILVSVMLSCTCAWALTESTSAPYISEKTESADIILAKDSQEGAEADPENPQNAEEPQESAAAGQTAGEDSSSEDSGQTAASDTEQAVTGNTDTDASADANAASASEDGTVSAPSEDETVSAPSEDGTVSAPSEDAEASAPSGAAAAVPSEDAAGAASSEETTAASPDQADEAAAAGTPDLDPGPVRQSSPYDVSPEAQKGYWASWGTGWTFMVDGAAYHGWLNDTDGKRYYLNDEGVMATGWLKEDGATYYLDEDGIMQTGLVTIDGRDYNFDPTGKCTDCQ